MSSKAAKSNIARSVTKKKHVAAIIERNPRFATFAEHVVSPGDYRPNLVPSLCPSRAGAVTYPLVLDITGMSDFAIVVQPDIARPVMVTHAAAIVENALSINCKFEKQYAGAGCELQATAGCEVESMTLDGDIGIPFYSVAGCSLGVNFTPLEGDDSSYHFDVRYHVAGGAWVSGPITADTMLGTTIASGTLAIPATVDAIGVHAYARGKSPTAPGNCTGTLTFVYAAGTGTCKSGPAVEGVFDVFAPEWEKVLSVADKICIPYMDALVTYQGSTLNNEGSIAVASCSEELSPVNGEYYQAIASRPFDNYEGRLASQGETEGGAHWHLLHDDIAAYSLTNTTELVTGPRGYFGIKGMNAGQVLRLQVHITLNYYTLDPSFAMDFQPPWGSMDLMLHALRTDVPLCSSNDGHLNKIKRVAKRKAMQAATWALNNPEKAAALAMAASESLGALMI